MFINESNTWGGIYRKGPNVDHALQQHVSRVGMFSNISKYPTVFNLFI